MEHRDTLDPEPGRGPTVVVEPHPAWFEVNEKKGGYKVYRWRYRCTECGSVGMGWKAKVSAMSQSGEHRCKETE